MTMNAISPEREERRRRQKELADQLKASGAMDEIFAKIDAGEPLTGEQGLLGGMLKAALERGLDAVLYPNSRNGTTTKTVSTEVGDIELAVPRDRNGSFTPMLVRKGQRRLDGLDGMIISLGGTSRLRGRCRRDDDPRHSASPGLDARHRSQPRDDLEDH